MPLEFTRAMLEAILAGELDHVSTTEDPFFGLNVPDQIKGVPSEVLNARSTWADQDAYDRQAGKLAAMFTENFERYAGTVDEAVRMAGPRTKVAGPA
jgi:phosphoenolpyruvate carboxykinase (ATP)